MPKKTRQQIEAEQKLFRLGLAAAGLGALWLWYRTQR